MIVTDKLASYQVAHRELVPSVQHRRSKYLNNRAENSHQPAPLAGQRFVGRLTEDVAQVGDRGGDFGNPAAVRGLRANPAMVAAGS